MRAAVATLTELELMSELGEVPETAAEAVKGLPFAYWLPHGDVDTGLDILGGQSEASLLTELLHLGQILAPIYLIQVKQSHH